ncbi:MAG: hypothetical protein P1V81_11540 [Planctomycetota bacterium]|nr:hypothetical protein [Planctomycetota bacterium]
MARLFHAASAPRYAPPIGKSLTHLLLVALLIPQLCLAGLGMGLVVCIAPGGHLELELSETGICCDEEQAPREDLGHGDQCNACTDVEVRFELPADRPVEVANLAGLPLELPACLAPLAPAPQRRACLQAPLREPPHLGRLAVVRLRC